MHNTDNVFRKYGIYNRSELNWQHDKDKNERWRLGKTGMPIVDAFMR